MASKEEIIQSLYAFSEMFVFPIERDFTPHAQMQFAAEHWSLCCSLVVAYLVVIFGGKALMADRAPFDLRIPLAIWNAALSLFSTIGMIRTLPWLFANLLKHGHEVTVCVDPINTWGSGPTGFWVMIFMFSKVPELLDTVFIVLRKKPLLFLHWYHHVTVLMFSWSAFSTMAGTGLYFVGMNFFVHSIMYGYYCLQALNMCPKWFPTVLITIAQIVQMIVGTGLCISMWYFVLSGIECPHNRTNLIAGALMYASYLYLFCEFAMKRYGKKPTNKKE